MFPESLIADRTKLVELSGIRKVFELGKTLKDPVNLSIGQPHFDAGTHYLRERRTHRFVTDTRKNPAVDRRSRRLRSRA